MMCKDSCVRTSSNIDGKNSMLRNWGVFLLFLRIILEVNFAQPESVMDGITVTVLLSLGTTCI